MRWVKKSISKQLLAYWLVISLVPLILSSLIFYQFAEDALINRSFEQLTSIRETKKKQLSDFFAFQMNLVEVLSQSPAIHQAFVAYDSAYRKGVDSDFYGQTNTKHHPYLSKIKETYRLYDLFLVNLDGDIIYTVVHEPDFATNLLHGPYRDQNIARAFQQAKDKNTIVDFDHYAPSQDQPASFVASPLYVGSELQGVLITQLPLDQIDEITQERSGLGESGEVYIVGQDYLMRSDSRFSDESTVLKLKVETIGTQNALAGKSGTQIIADYRGVEVLSSFAPLEIGPLRYAFLAEIDEEEILAPVHQLMMIVSLLIGLSIVVIYLVALYFSRSFSKPIRQMKDTILLLAQGILPDKISRINKIDELGAMSEAIITMHEGYGKTAIFARELGEGKLQQAYEALSEQDVLGNALLKMRQELIRNAEENEIRNWSAEGLARFVQLLRHTQDVGELGRKLLSQLVSYLDANQAALFVSREEGQERYLELIACYAYGREKFMQQKILPGEGLAGQAFQEQEKILLTDIPEDYINISSGLGESRPRSVLIFPLKLNDEVEGILEIASFQEFPEHVINFVEKLSENLAATIRNIRINEHTQNLLNDSQQKAEILQSQEEEMRQNMEELSATQEEMRRKEQAYLDKIEALEQQLTQS